MTSTTETATDTSRPPRASLSRARRASLARYTPQLTVIAVAFGVLVVALRFGGPAVVLWLGFAALTGAVLLFWEVVRLLIDPNAAGDEYSADSERGELEARRRAALRALKDIEFEHSIQRLSDEDYAGLKEQYRAEARAAMAAMDERLGVYLERADELIKRATGEVSAPSVASTEALDDASRKNRKKNRKGAAEAPKDAPVAAKAEAGVRVEALDPELEKLAKVAQDPEAMAAMPRVDATDTKLAVLFEDVAEAGLIKPSAAASMPTREDRVCAGCATRNDGDAVFCKKCGARMAVSA